MKSKPVKSANLEPESIPLLKEKNRKLQIQIDKLQNKMLRLENKTLKQEQKILKLEAEAKIRKERPSIIIVKGTHGDSSQKLIDK